MPVRTAISPAVKPLPAAFHRLAWSNLAAQSAEQIGLAATPIVAVFALGAGAGQTGWLQTAQTLPFLILSMLLGACGTVAYNVAAPSLVTALVDRSAWATANGRTELARSVAYSAGPALGGLLVGAIGAAAAFVAAAGLSAIAALLLAGIAEPQRAPSPRRRFSAELREGAAFVAGNPLLRAIVLTAIFFNVGFFIVQAVYVPYASRQLALSASGVGATLAAYGAGMIVGALAAPKVTARLKFGQVIIIGPLCGLAASLTLCATLIVPSAWLAAAAYFQLGVGPILWVISSTTLRQAITPEAMLGRVSALITTATYGARPLGALIGAMLGGAAGAKPCLIVAVVAFVIQAAVIVRSSAARLSTLPAAAASA
jgi:predicted MFS family arabinose efflux permease